MNQIPNIEEVLENFNKAFPLSIDYPETPKTVETQARWHIEVENRTNRAKNIRHHQLIWLRSLLTTLHHQLQKTRHDWLREEIVKLGGVKRIADEVPDGLTDIWQKSHNQALQTIIDRYQEELDQALQAIE